MLIIQIKQRNSLVVFKCKDIILLSVRDLGAVQMFSISINSEFVMRGQHFLKDFTIQTFLQYSRGRVRPNWDFYRNLSIKKNKKNGRKLT